MNASDFGQLLVFQAIAEEKSITAAAKKLNLAVPSVSISLKLLEHKMGVPLFTRTTRTIQLTDSGLQLWQNTSAHLIALNQAFEEVSEQHQTPRGTVKITLSQVHFDLIFKDILLDFYAQYPHITLDFSINNATVNLAEQGFDLGIRFGNTLADGVVARKIYSSIRQGIYVSNSYVEKYGIPQSPNDLAAHRMIGFYFMTAKKIEPFLLNIDGVVQEVFVHNVLILNDTDKIISAIHAGVGIGRIFDNAPDVALNGLIPVLEENWLCFPETFLYFMPNRYKAKRVQVVIDFLLQKNQAA